MKISVCDVCQKGNPSVLVKAVMRWRFKEGIKAISVDVCLKHKDWGKGKTYESALDCLFSALRIEKKIKEADNEGN